MKIRINGKEEPITQRISVADFISARKINPAVVVVEYNRLILDPSQWKTTLLHDADELEIISFVGGG